jgi:transcriptional regulator with XRE-family HTH domain
MSYGLDMSQVCYETDHEGNRTRVILPLPMFSALYGFWTEARRAQTAQIEANARPGMYRGSLAGVVRIEPRAAPEQAATGADANGTHEGKYGRKWADLIARMPAETSGDDTCAGPRIPAPTPADTARAANDATGASVARRRGALTPQVFFAREFEEPPPAEVIGAISAGVYFLRAWREYRRLTREDAAELCGKSPDAINWHENGYSRPRRETLERFAEIYDCPLAQLTPKAGSNTQPWLTVIEGDGCASSDATQRRTEQRAPDDTDYPDAVLAHMIAGKTPLTAWRLFRRLTLSQLAEQYGCSSKSVLHLEESVALRPATIAKLCPILHCRPEQLLRPESMETPVAPLRVREANADTQLERRRRTDGEARQA